MTTTGPEKQWPDVGDQVAIINRNAGQTSARLDVVGRLTAHYIVLTERADRFYRKNLLGVRSGGRGGTFSFSELAHPDDPEVTTLLARQRHARTLDRIDKVGTKRTPDGFTPPTVAELIGRWTEIAALAAATRDYLIEARTTLESINQEDQ